MKRTRFNDLCVIMSAISLYLVILAVCKKLPTFPDPVPTPSASPSAPPRLSPLRVAGSDFTDASGKRVYLLGVIPCCVGEIDWPLINSVGFRRPGSKGITALASVTESAMQRIADAGANFIHIRLGPFGTGYYDGSSSPEWSRAYMTVDGRSDLDNFNPEFLARVDGVISTAARLGLYVEVDLLDWWQLVVNKDFHPWDADHNIQHFEGASRNALRGGLHERAEAYVQKMLDVTAKHPNVIYQDGNEASRCEGCTEWALDIAALVHARGKLIGTNTGHPVVEAAADFAEYHTCKAPAPFGMPLMVNEFGGECDGTLSADEWEKQARAAASDGVSFHLWRGSMSDDQYGQALSRLRGIRESASR